MRVGNMLLGAVLGAATIMVVAHRRPQLVEAVNDAVADTATNIGRKSSQMFRKMKRQDFKKEMQTVIPEIKHEAKEMWDKTKHFAGEINDEIMHLQHNNHENDDKIKHQH
ncbi:hypothetical protein ACFSTH_04495 [Paenibacillus yanchengensis]|uniref:YtxH domain-containing protein n=1 Tax=Paenibacillus yanchengensis TaxID=2035833 RepID=A0ABW4YK09_9BACL